jgi:hypothetical protein
MYLDIQNSFFLPNSALRNKRDVFVTHKLVVDVINSIFKFFRLELRRAAFADGYRPFGG